MMRNEIFSLITTFAFSVASVLLALELKTSRQKIQVLEHQVRKMEAVLKVHNIDTGVSFEEVEKQIMKH